MLKIKPVNKEIEHLRSRCCHNIQVAASKNDLWRMQRFQFLNRYFYDLEFSA